MNFFKAANRNGIRGTAANVIPLGQSSNLSRQMDAFEAINRNGTRCSAPVPAPSALLVSAGAYYKDPGIGLGGAGGMSGLEAMSALRVGREDTPFHGFVEGEVDEDEEMEIDMEGYELPEGIDEHDRFYVKC
jgi:hypothetical protein